MLAWTVAACLFGAVSPPDAPRLVVIVAVDQLIPEQLERLAPELSGGLGRFQHEGTVFPHAMLGYARTETGAGHATLATGVWPNKSGITGNMIYRRDHKAWEYCFGDSGVAGVSSPPGSPGGVSAANLCARTLGDWLKESFAGSRTVAVSGKDRSAIAMGGPQAEVAVWWDRRQGGFMSTRAFARDGELPGFVLDWNEDWADRAAGFEWTVPSIDLAALGTAPDVREGEAAPGTLPRTFSDRIDNPRGRAQLAGEVFGSPLMDRFVLEVATRAVQERELGADDEPDLLALGLSATDVIGHACGPYSVEVTTSLLALDQDLEQFFAMLDGEVGPGRWLAVLAADHGVLELPESLPADQAGRDLEGPWRQVQDAITAALAAEYPEGSVNFRLENGAVNFDNEGAESGGLDPAEVRQVIAAAAAASRWVEAAYTMEQVLAGEAGEDPYLELYHRSHPEDRCPDVSLRTRSGRLLQIPIGTTHGSPYPYDRRVALAFYGPGVPAVIREDEADTVDLVPTVLARLGLEVADGFDGRVLDLAPTDPDDGSR